MRKKYNISFVITIDRDKRILHSFLNEISTIKKNNLVNSYNVCLVDPLNIFCVNSFKDVKRKYSNLELIYLSNLGTRDQIISIAKGISFLTADLILIIDSDMYENLSHFDLFVDKVNLGANVVYGDRVYRNDVSLLRLFMSKIYNKLCSLVVGVDISDLNTPMILLTKNASRLLRMQSSTFSARFYIAYRYKKTLAEVRITTNNTHKKKSNYSFFNLVRVGVLRYLELILFAFFLSNRFLRKKTWWN